LRAPHRRRKVNGSQPGSLAEIYLDNATMTGKVSGDVKIVRVDGKKQ
jgi:hypothetical protein